MLSQQEDSRISGRDFWDFGNTEKPNRSNVNKYKLTYLETDPKLLCTKWDLGSTIAIDIFFKANSPNWYHHRQGERKAWKRGKKGTVWNTKAWYIWTQN